MMPTMYSNDLKIFSFLNTWPIESIMFILTSDDWPTGVNHKDTIMAFHIARKMGILLISNPFKFLFVLEPVNIYIHAFALEVFRTWTSVFGMLVILWIRTLVISIGSSSQIYPSWYQLTIKFAASSFNCPKLAICGTPRRCLIASFLGILY